jgi:CspA family cold shock protein
MFFRAFITSGLVALLFLVIMKLINLQGYESDGMLYMSTYWHNFLLTSWLIGLLSIAGFFYGRKIKRIWKKETGTIKWFDPSKGYGFLIRDKGGDLFVHFKSVKEKDRKKVKEDTRVKFSVETNEKGPQAENIEIIK